MSERFAKYVDLACLAFIGLIFLGALGLFTQALSQVSGCSGVSFVPSCRPTFATVATLPTCNAASQGVMYMVNDANAPTALATVAGAGAVHVGVTCNGANWIVQ